MEKITLANLAAVFEAVAKIMAENADALCEMDAKMGDGDLGLTMKKGFGALPGLLSEMEEADIGKRLAKAGLKMTSIVPSTMGTLMASGILSGGKAVTGRTELDAAGFAAYLGGFAQGIQKRGKCAPGDRTVLDAILPAAQRAAQAAEKGAALAETAREALAGADAGVEATKTMTPKYGKAAAFAARDRKSVV